MKQYLTNPVARVALILSLAGAAAGCDGDPFASGRAPRGEYELVAVNGAPLPAVVLDYGGVVHTLHRQRLKFDGAGRVEFTRVLEVVSPHDGEAGMRGDFREFEYRVRGRFVDIGSFAPCPPQAICVGFVTGDIRGRSLVVPSLFYVKHEMVYRRR
jgi:hypothetical protein